MNPIELIQLLIYHYLRQRSWRTACTKGLPNLLHVTMLYQILSIALEYVIRSYPEKSDSATTLKHISILT